MVAINMKQKQLEILSNDFELLSKTTLLQMQILIKLLHDNSIRELYEDASDNEVIIDRLEIKIREEVVFTIFQFTPRAMDLRRIITYQDITTNLERVGDMLLNIMRSLLKLEERSVRFKAVLDLLSTMTENVNNMLRKSIVSFTNEDSQVAYQILKDDDVIDLQFRQVRDLLQNYGGEELSKEEIYYILQFFSIAHNLERIGDSATNIAESTIYLAEGKDVRHGNKG